MAIGWKCLESVAGLAAGLVAVASRCADPSIVALTVVSASALIGVLGEENARSGPESENALEKVREAVRASIIRDVILGAAAPADLNHADEVLALRLPGCMLDRSRLAASAVHKDRFPERAADLIVESLAQQDAIFAADDTSETCRAFARGVIEAALTAALDDRDYFERFQPHLLIAMAQGIGRVEAGVDEVKAKLDRLLAIAEGPLVPQIAMSKGVEEAPLREVLKKLGEADIPVEQIPAALNRAADELLQLRADLARLRNDRPEFAAVRARALALIDKGEFDAARAQLREGRNLARAMHQEIGRSEAGFLLDEARVDRLQYHYDAATAKLIEAGELDPTDCWIAIELGDLWITRGVLTKAGMAFREAATIALTAGNERDLAVSYDRIGGVLVDQGNLPDALKSFRDGLAIADSLAKADPGNAGWQRDLSVSYNRIGDVLVAQGNLPDALKSFRDGLAIHERLVEMDSSNALWRRDLLFSQERNRRVLRALEK